MTKERIAQTTANYVAAAKRARAGRLRLRRNPRRARLPDLAIPRAVREPPHRRIRRLAGEPRPLRPRRAARGEGRGAVARRDLPALGRGLFRRRADLRRRPRHRDLGGAGRRRRAARHRRALPLQADGAPHDPADDRAGRDVPRLRRRREEGDQGAGDRGRPARRSGDRDGRRWRAARRISSRSAARWSPIRNGSTSCAATSRSAAASPATPASTACAAAPASPAWSTARPAARAHVRQRHRRRTASASR